MTRVRAGLRARRRDEPLFREEVGGVDYLPERKGKHPELALAAGEAFVNLAGKLET